MTKKSGLADSPFFVQPKPQIESSIPLSPVEADKPLTRISETILPDSPTPQKENVSSNDVQVTENQDQKRPFERSNERTMERTNIRPPKKNRKKIRHTFDIYKDQLIALQGIQFEKVKAGKKKPKLGKMVSDGIDLYLKQWASKHKQG